MSKRVLKIISVLLCVAVMISVFSVGVLTADSGAKLYNTYGDQMLFQQNEEIRIAGTAPKSATISCEIISNGTVIRSSSAKANNDGTFIVSMEGIEGGYKEYNILCRSGGVLFDTLEKVVFGELWIASGQSNMQMSMAQSLEGAELIKNGKLGNRWVRYLNIPATPVYNGSASNIPLNPQNDVNGAYWCNGEETKAGNASAVGFFFGEKLHKDLDIPVGVVSLALGGSSIYTWISREAIEGNEAVLNDAKNVNAYYTADEWKESKQNTYADATSNYNNKIYPVRNLKPAGMIWYQGESNMGAPYGSYSRAFDLMQTSYSDLLGFKNGELLPIIYTQLASYHYNDDNLTVLPQMNMEFAEIQNAKPEYRALTTIYDIELTYTLESHSIHPVSKKPIGDKMAHSALGLIYGERDDYTAPFIKSVEIKNGAVYVSLKNTGDGLIIKQSNKYSTPDPIYGCTIAGENGIFVEADAEIVAPDTIRIHSDVVTNPVAATYAYSETSETANLYSSSNGKPVFGVSAFTTKRLSNAKYIQTLDWSNCEIQNRWHTITNKYSGDFSTWKVSKNTGLSFNDRDFYKGTASLQLKTDEKKFFASPIMHYNQDGLPFVFDDTDTNYSNYKTLKFMVKNIGTNELKLDEFRIYTSSKLWFSPAVSGTNSTDYIIPADGKWHSVTLDLDNLYLYGKDGGMKGSRFDLKEVFDFRLSFEGTDTSTVLIDDFVFTPATKSTFYKINDLGSFIRFVFPVVQAIFDFFQQAEYYVNVAISLEWLKDILPSKK